MKKDEMATEIADLKRALAGVDATIRKLTSEYAEAKAEVLRLVHAVEPVDRIVANIHALVDRGAAEWAAAHRQDLIVSCSTKGRLDRAGEFETIGAELPDLVGLNGASFGDLLGLFPELIKSRLEQVVRSEAIESPGTIETRSRQLDVARARVRKIEDDHEQICELAAKMTPPINVPRLPGVAERLADEAEKRRRREEFDAVRNHPAEIARRERATYRPPTAGSF